MHQENLTFFTDILLHVALGQLDKCDFHKKLQHCQSILTLDLVLISTDPTFNSCTKFVVSPVIIHDRMPGRHLSFLGIDT